ncbi:hypothetical protein ACVWZZ_002621 [Bradyrhizobium sp. LM6.10]
MYIFKDCRPLRVKDGCHFVDMCIDTLENLPRHDVAFWKN